MLRRMSEHQVVANATVYVVDADTAVREGLQALFAALPNPVRVYPSAEEFLAELPAAPCGCLIVELNLPGIDGLELLEQLRQRGIQLPVIMLATSSDVPTAVRAMRGGALDFIDKPFVDRVLLSRVRQVLTMAPVVT